MDEKERTKKNEWTNERKRTGKSSRIEWSNLIKKSERETSNDRFPVKFSAISPTKRLQTTAHKRRRKFDRKSRLFSLSLWLGARVCPRACMCVREGLSYFRLLDPRLTAGYILFYIHETLRRISGHSEKICSLPPPPSIFSPTTIAEKKYAIFSFNIMFCVGWFLALNPSKIKNLMFVGKIFSRALKWEVARPRSFVRLDDTASWIKS